MQKSRVQHPNEDISVEVHVWMPTIRQWQQVKTAGPGPRQTPPDQLSSRPPAFLSVFTSSSVLANTAEIFPLEGDSTSLQLVVV